MKQIILSAFFACTLASQGIAQDIVPITWDQLKAKGLDKNLQIQQAQKDTKIAEAELSAARSLFLPDVTASYGFVVTNDPMMAFGTRLSQKRIKQEDFQPDLLNHPNSISDFATQLTVQQPIINVDGMYQKKAGQSKAEALRMKSIRTKERMEFELKKAFMGLQLAYKVKQTLEEALSTVAAHQKLVQDYLDNGMVQKADLLDVEVRLTEIRNQLHQAESGILNASDYIFFLLNEDGEGKVLRPEKDLQLEEFPTEYPASLNEDRADFLAYQKSIESYSFMSKSAQAKFLPRLNAFGSFGLHNRKIGTFRNEGYMAGIQLSWNLFDGLKANSERKTYLANQDKMQTEFELHLKSSELELQKTYRQLSDARNSVALAEQALRQSEEAYRIRKNRFEEGLEKNTDLLEAESKVDAKKLAYQQAIYEYNTTLTYYQFLK